MTEKMAANSCWDNKLEEIRRRAHERQFWQDVAAKQVASDESEENSRQSGDLPGENSSNLCRNNEIQREAQRSERREADSVPRNALAGNDLCKFEEQQSEKNPAAKCGSATVPSKVARFSKFNFARFSKPSLVRFSKFNFVGGIGIAVQFAALFLLKTVFNFNYLAATALAVETAVLHNFVWHERFTWAYRITHPAQGFAVRTSGAKAPAGRKRLIAALKRCATQPKRCATQNLRSSRLARLARFHVSNGGSVARRQPGADENDGGSGAHELSGGQRDRHYDVLAGEFPAERRVGVWGEIATPFDSLRSLCRDSHFSQKRREVGHPSLRPLMLWALTNPSTNMTILAYRGSAHV